MNLSRDRSISLVKYGIINRRVRFSANRRQASRLLKTLRRELGAPKNLQVIERIRDRIYFEVQRKSSGPGAGSSVGLSEATGGEGATSAALLLALSLGELKRNKVLFIDGTFDQRRFTMYQEIFGLTRNALECGNGFSHLQYFTAKNRNLCFLGSRVGVDGVELFSHAEFSGLLAELKRSFDYILFNMPPILSHSITRLVLPAVEHFYLVCTPGRTRFEDIERVKALAADIGGGISGAIITGQRTPFWARWFGRETFV